MTAQDCQSAVSTSIKSEVETHGGDNQSLICSHIWMLKSAILSFKVTGTDLLI